LNRHRVHVAVVDAQGRLVAQAGDPAYYTFWRSAAKPFQALPLVEDGVVARFGLTRQDLALTCASHSSEPRRSPWCASQRMAAPAPSHAATPPGSDAVAKD
jgi:L-asparaginase II